MKLPTHNIQKLLDKQVVQSENSTKLIMKKHNYSIVNSCNGLLCLSKSSNNDPVVVCNPVTGEYTNLNLPEARTVERHGITCGFGFSPVTNQYKVIRIFIRWTRRVTRYDKVIVAEVHTLGTKTWRVLPVSPNKTHVLFPTYLNWCVYWLSYDQPYWVTCFDIGKECFESIPVPTPLDFNGLESKNMGVLGVQLFISGSGHNDVRVWEMKDNSAHKSWSQILSFHSNDDKLPYGSYQPIKYLNNGALLLFDSDKNAFLCKDLRQTGFRYLKVHGFKSEVEVFAHIPSFVPLKQALSGHNVEALNVESSRCTELKLLHREDQVISIVEQNSNLKRDSEDLEY